MSSSSKKSVQEKKEDFNHRVQQLKHKLYSTKNSNRDYTHLPNAQNTLFHPSGYSKPQFAPPEISPTSHTNPSHLFQPRSHTSSSKLTSKPISHPSGQPKITLHTSTDHAFSNPHLSNPHPANTSQNLHNTSYYSCNSLQKPSQILPDYKRDGATLLVDRIRRLLRKSFKPLKWMYQRGITIQEWRNLDQGLGLNRSYATIQPEINRRRSLSRRENQRRNNKSLR